MSERKWRVLACAVDLLCHHECGLAKDGLLLGLIASCILLEDAQLEEA